MDPVAVYTPDLSIKGKARRRLVRLVRRRPARMALDRPMVSFTFDDAPASALSRGRAVLEASGVRGSFYIAADLAGREGPMGRFATADEIRAAAAAGHEIASHTHNHLDCGAQDRRAIEADAARNDAALQAWGLPRPTNFAFPFGDVSAAAKAALGRRFDVLRALHHGVIENGADLNQAPAVGVEGPDGEGLAWRWLERAAARKAWLILFTHDVSDTPSPWGCTPAALERLIQGAQVAGFDIVTVAEGARRLGR
jgi:peptidoglycan/xylan/chitin deacetylase (PgdA/CDA1 family)